jgi:hypothetical protein
MRTPVRIERRELEGFAASNPCTPDPRIRDELPAIDFSRSATSCVWHYSRVCVRSRRLVGRDSMRKRERGLV